MEEEKKNPASDAIEKINECLQRGSYEMLDAMSKDGSLPLKVRELAKMYIAPAALNRIGKGAKRGQHEIIETLYENKSMPEYVRIIAALRLIEAYAELGLGKKLQAIKNDESLPQKIREVAEKALSMLKEKNPIAGDGLTVEPPKNLRNPPQVPQDKSQNMQNAGKGRLKT